MTTSHAAMVKECRVAGSVPPHVHTKSNSKLTASLGRALDIAYVQSHLLFCPYSAQAVQGVVCRQLLLQRRGSSRSSKT